MKNPLKYQSIRTKMFVLVTIVLLGTIFAVLWKTRQIFFEDKYDFIRQLSSKISASSGKLAQQKLVELENQLALFVSTKESLQKGRGAKDTNSVLFERFDEFMSVSIQKQMGDEWVTRWTQINHKNSSEWTDSFVETILRSQDYQTLGTGQIHLQRFEDASGQPFFALYFLADLKGEGDKTGQLSSIVGFLKADFLRDIIMDYKGDLNTVFIVDNKGYVYAHPDDEAIGISFEDHPVVKEIVQGRETGSGQYQMKNKEDIIGNYNLIPGTNLYMVVTTPERQAFVAARDLLITVLTFGVGFLIIGSVLAFVLSSKITKPISELKDIANLIGAGDFKVEVNVKSNDEVGELANSIDVMKKSLLERDEKIENSKAALVQSEKMSAFGQLSAGIAHEVKNPLAGILGHAQLGKGKSKDPEVTKHLDMIERETRRTKEIIENLMKFARAEKPDLTPTDLFEAVGRAVDLVDHQLSLQGIKIIKDLHSTSKVSANANQVQQVLLNLMMNAGHAMEPCKVKELKVSVEDKGEVVQIRIKDTGSGMSPEVQKRIFEPFFTTKPAGKGTGLGLSVSFGIVRDHKAKIYVESKVGEGTTFFIDFPILGSAAAQVAATEPVQAASTAATGVAISMTPAEPPKPEPFLPSPTALSTEYNNEQTKSGIKKEETNSKIKFPEFSGKTETVLDGQVQRDYLKSGHQSVTKNIHDLKKEASKILETERKELKEKNPEKASEKIEDKIQNIKNEIANTEVEIKTMMNPTAKASGDDDQFKVAIRKPKLKA